MSEINLKPCPFCGKEAEFFIIDIKTYNREKAAEWGFTIRCTNCGVKNPHLYILSVTLNKNAELQHIIDERQNAIDDWNRRAKDND